MPGNKIGVLKNRIYDASLVMKNGGYAELTSTGNLHEGTLEMIDRLREKHISGFLLDKYSYAYVYAHMAHLVHTSGSSGSGEGISEALYFLNKTHHNVITRSGEINSYGILIKERADYNYFRWFVSDNVQNIQVCKEMHMHVVPPDKEVHVHDIFSRESGLLMVALNVSGVLLAAIMLFGLGYEAVRKKFWRKLNRGVEKVAHKETLFKILVDKRTSV